MTTIYGTDRRDFLVYREGMGGTVEIFDIAVYSKRGAGVGRGLVNQLLKSVRGHYLVVFAITRISNTIAQQFYEALGFRLCARLHNFYCEAVEKSRDDSSSRKIQEHGMMYVLDLPTDPKEELCV